MYSLNRMVGFNKPLVNNRQYGSSTTTLNNSQHNMVLKPEYLGNDHFKFLNNFGIQPHLITDKKFADINSVKPQTRNFYPSNYSCTPGHRNTERVEQNKNMHDDIASTEQIQNAETIVPPTASLKCKQSETPTHLDMKHTKTLHVTNKPSKTCKMPKKSKRKRKQTKREGGSSHCEKSPQKNKPWHKSSLKFEIMEMEDVPTEKSMESPVTPLDVEEICLPINAIEPQCSLSVLSPTKSPNCCSVPKLESCHKLRLPSECESEDSFIIFDASSNSFDTDIVELDEFEYSSSDDDECDDDNDGICSMGSSLEDVWPTKRVRFADDKDLCEVHPMVQWSFAYQKARKGPWEQYALDRTRFQRRISYLESTLNIILQPEHRNKIFNERFLKGNS